MGLDQYVHMRDDTPDVWVEDLHSPHHSCGNKAACAGCAWEAGETELHYWRKHYNLHDWIKRLWAKRQMLEPDDFGSHCLVRLLPEDVDALEVDVHGESEFIAEARKALADGRAMYYSADW